MPGRSCDGIDAGREDIHVLEIVRQTEISHLFAQFPLRETVKNDRSFFLVRFVQYFGEILIIFDTRVAIELKLEVGKLS